MNASNINKTYDEKMYVAPYFQDDWKVNPKLTINLGVRWDYFGPIERDERRSGQLRSERALRIGGPDVHHSGHRERQPYAVLNCQHSRSCRRRVYRSAGRRMVSRLMQTDQYGQGLLQTQKANFAPRIGFA